MSGKTVVSVSDSGLVPGAEHEALSGSATAGQRGRAAGRGAAGSSQPRHPDPSEALVPVASAASAAPAQRRRWAASTRSSGTTRAGLVYERLRADILAGRLAPGTRLPFGEVTVTYGCSVGSVREALQRLTEQGLVESVVQQGFRVVTISRDDLLDLTAARCEIEVLALRLSIEHGDVTWEANLVAAHHVLERTPTMDPADPARQSDDWARAHDGFHAALIAGCGNRRILSVAHSLRDSAELYRRWSAPLYDRARDIAGEHRAMLDATVSRRSAEATRLLTAHIQRTTDALLPALELQDTPADHG